MDREPQKLSNVIGRQLRFIRESRGWSQEDLARQCLAAGLAWTSTTVAKTERGERPVSLDEFVGLSIALLVPLADLVPDDAPVRVGTGGGVMSGRAVRQLLAGEDPDELDPNDIDTPLDRVLDPLLQRHTELMEAAHLAAKRYWPSGQRPAHQRTYWPLPEKSPSYGDIQRAAVDSLREAEQKAARRLGIDAVELSVIAHRLWGRGLTDERDRRLVGADLSPRERQAMRGHCTRTLLAEIRATLDDPGSPNASRGERQAGDDSG